MEIVYKASELKRVAKDLFEMGGLNSEGSHSKKRPILVDRFLENATEVDVDVIRDGEGDVLVGGIMEHVEEAGIHSGDSACSVPSQTLTGKIEQLIREHAQAIASELKVVGLLNIQFAVQDEQVYVIEANPRASRTVPYLAKATGISLAKIATHVILGKTLKEVAKSGISIKPTIHGKIAVKEAVMPFNRFPEVDQVLGPEMKSTGEVMGMDDSFELAYLKSQIASWQTVPKYGIVFISVSDRDKAKALEAARILTEVGFAIAATDGTGKYLEKHDVLVAITVSKLGREGTDAVKLIQGGAIQMVINSPTGRSSRADGRLIRQAASNKRILCYTSARAGLAAAQAIVYARRNDFTITSLQDAAR